MYLIKENGESIFQGSMPYEFLLHCYYVYTERTNERLFLVDFSQEVTEHISLSACDGFINYLSAPPLGVRGLPKYVCCDYARLYFSGPLNGQNY